jgi:hypothetical protein
MSKVNFLIYNNYNFKKNLKSEIHAHTHTHKHLNAKNSKYVKVLSLRSDAIFLEDIINNENPIFKAWFVDHSTGKAKGNGEHGIVGDNRTE